MESLNRIELAGFVGTARVFPIGDGTLADAVVVYDKPNQTNWDKPYKVYRDCM